MVVTFAPGARARARWTSAGRYARRNSRAALSWKLRTRAELANPGAEPAILLLQALQLLEQAADAGSAPRGRDLPSWRLSSCRGRSTPPSELPSTRPLSETRAECGG
jgi:hypothetical protein